VSAINHSSSSGRNSGQIVDEALRGLRLCSDELIAAAKTALSGLLITEKLRCAQFVGDNSASDPIKVLQSRISGEDSGQFFSHKELVDKALRRMSDREALGSNENTIRRCFSSALKQEVESYIHLLSSNNPTDPFSAIKEHHQIGISDESKSGLFPESQTDTKKWGEWYPGLNNSELTLGDVLKTLPGVSETDLPEVLYEFEDPNSPKALVGAVQLDRHDVIHVLLGRGLLDQDEAFVLGFTMGTCQGGAPSEQISKMIEALTLKYPEPYRIPGQKSLAFKLGVKCAESMPDCKNIFDIPLEQNSFRKMKIGELRKKLGIDLEILKSSYREEASQIPNTIESARLAKERHEESGF